VKGSPSRSRGRSLPEELAVLGRLDVTVLKERWRALYRSEAPVHIGRRSCSTWTPIDCRKRLSAASDAPRGACSSASPKVAVLLVDFTGATGTSVKVQVKGFALMWLDSYTSQGEQR
jgi:hypothetical protein